MSVGGLGSSLTQHLLCQAAQKSGSFKAIRRPTVLIYLFLFLFFFFPSRQGTAMTFLQGHQDEWCTFCVSKHRKALCSVTDILFGPDTSYSPGPIEEAASWATTSGIHTHSGLGVGAVCLAMKHWPCCLCSPEFSLCFLQKPLYSQTHLSYAH